MEQSRKKLLKRTKMMMLLEFKAKQDPVKMVRHTKFKISWIKVVTLTS